jgi:hypothetical protein
LGEGDPMSVTEIEFAPGATFTFKEHEYHIDNITSNVWLSATSDTAPINRRDLFGSIEFYNNDPTNNIRVYNLSHGTRKHKRVVRVYKVGKQAWLVTGPGYRIPSCVFQAAGYTPNHEDEQLLEEIV